VEKLEAALKSIINSMANCEFYANTYTEALNVYFRTPSTSIAWVEKLENALPQFYAAILVFAFKRKDTSLLQPGVRLYLPMFKNEDRK
jgi:hypothetical protein